MAGPWVRCYCAMEKFFILYNFLGMDRSATERQRWSVRRVPSRSTKGPQPHLYS